MRVISGYLRGRNFSAPGGHRTHPMGDKIRGALFNILGDIKGLSVLDAFAGSGAISFEAISRGAKQVVAVEADKTAHTAIVNNRESLQIEEVKLDAIYAHVAGWSRRHQNDLFDVVICDPPYDDMQEKIVEKLAKHTKPEGIFVVSMPPHARIFLLPEKFVELSQKSYGDSSLVFYRRTA